MSQQSQLTPNIIKKVVRLSFIIFTQEVFPNAKWNTIEYKTVCSIEDEFRRQEKLLISTQHPIDILMPAFHERVLTLLNTCYLQHIGININLN